MSLHLPLPPTPLLVQFYHVPRRISASHYTRYFPSHFMPRSTSICNIAICKKNSTFSFLIHAHSSQFMNLRTSFFCLSAEWEQITCSVSPHNAARFVSWQVARPHQRSSGVMETITGTQVTRLKFSEGAFNMYSQNSLILTL